MNFFPTWNKCPQNGIKQRMKIEKSKSLLFILLFSFLFACLSDAAPLTLDLTTSTTFNTLTFINLNISSINTSSTTSSTTTPSTTTSTTTTVYTTQYEILSSPSPSLSLSAVTQLNTQTNGIDYKSTQFKQTTNEEKINKNYPKVNLPIPRIMS